MYTTAASCFLFVAVLSDISGGTKEELLTMAFASTWPVFGMSRLYVKVWMGVRVTREVSYLEGIFARIVADLELFYRNKRLHPCLNWRD